MSPASSCSPAAMPRRGLETKSIAPSSRALNVTSAPRSVSVETITTGVGRKRINRSRNSSPSILGISISSVSTSGFNARIISRATSGSGAAPIASRSGWRFTISVSRLRTSAESSMIRTRVFTMDDPSEQLDLAADLAGIEPRVLLLFRAVAPRQSDRIGLGPRALRTAGQHEMVHPADLREPIPHAGRYARAEHGRQHDVRVRYEVLARQQFDRVAVGFALVVHGASLADRARQAWGRQRCDACGSQVTAPRTRSCPAARTTPGSRG